MYSIFKEKKVKLYHINPHLQIKILLAIIIPRKVLENQNISTDRFYQ
jgi:hypothetical protein